MREQSAHRNPALSVVLVFPKRFHQRTRFCIGKRQRPFDGERLSVIAVQTLFGIEAVDMRNASVHEKENDAFGFGRKVRCLGRKRIGNGVVTGRQEVRESQESESTGGWAASPP